MNSKGLVLGIDIGTSSVKVSVLDSQTLESVYAKSIPTKAKINSHHPKGDEQDAIKIFKSMQECLKSVPENLSVKVFTIY